MNYLKKIRKNECSIVNIFFHWVCYFKNKNQIYYFDSVGEDAPTELKNYFKGNRLLRITILDLDGSALAIRWQ